MFTRSKAFSLRWPTRGIWSAQLWLDVVRVGGESLATGRAWGRPSTVPC